MWLMNFIMRNMSFDLVMTILISCIILYYMVTSEKRKYKFEGLNGIRISDDFIAMKPKPEKKVNMMEEECRKIFEGIFRREFRSCRPDFLKNPATNKNLELDGFCPTIPTPIGMGLAFEYDGQQHSQYNPHFHKKGVDEFVYQTKKDTFKDLKCRERGILLIRIPYYVVKSDLHDFILQKLRRKGMRV